MELVEQLLPLFSAESLGSALSRTVEAVARVTNARCAALFLFEGDLPAVEHWFPEDESTRARFRHVFEGWSVESRRHGEVVDARLPRGFKPACRARQFPLELDARLQGVLVLASLGALLVGMVCLRMFGPIYF